MAQTVRASTSGLCHPLPDTLYTLYCASPLSIVYLAPALLTGRIKKTSNLVKKEAPHFSDFSYISALKLTNTETNTNIRVLYVPLQTIRFVLQIEVNFITLLVYGGS